MHLALCQFDQVGSNIGQDYEFFVSWRFLLAKQGSGTVYALVRL